MLLGRCHALVGIAGRDAAGEGELRRAFGGVGLGAEEGEVDVVAVDGGVAAFAEGDFVGAPFFGGVAGGEEGGGEGEGEGGEEGEEGGEGGAWHIVGVGVGWVQMEGLQLRSSDRIVCVCESGEAVGDGCWE